MAIFVTGDLHYGHANIIKYCKRPFADVEEMDEVLVRNWNSVVSDGDEVYYLGDLAFFRSRDARYSNLINSLNGRIYWVKGNHDPSQKEMSDIASRHPEKIAWTGLNLTLVHAEHKYFLTHRPIDASPHMPTIAGHVHEKWRAMGKGSLLREFRSEREVVLKHPVVNAGVDVWGFKPARLEDALAILKNGPYDGKKDLES